jgi:hypothetical protein
MTRSVHRFAAVVVVIASCGNEPAPRTGCDVYVDALEECLVELGLPVDPGLRRRVGCGPIRANILDASTVPCDNTS